jgi:phytoene dehydrogenase-like protein
MAKEYDVVVIGGGHNGLIAANYLAKAGLDVVVLEQAKKIGGGTCSYEVTAPGFKSDLAAMAHQFIQFNPILAQDELGLRSKYGLDYIIADGPQCGCIWDDGRNFVVYKDIEKTIKNIERFSPKDAIEYRKFYEESNEAYNMLMSSSQMPAPNFGEFFSFLDDTPEGQENIRMILSSAMDIINEHFESEEVRTYLARYTAEAMVLPFQKGTGSYLSMMVCSTHNFGMAIPVGGSQALPDALEKSLNDLGGTIITEANVTKVNAPNGVAKSVVLASGEEIVAKRAVISAINVKQLFGTLLTEPVETVSKIQRLRPNAFGAMKIHLALNEPLRWKASKDEPDLNYCMLTEYDRKDFDSFFHGLLDLNMGNIVTDMFAFSQSSLVDPSRCPEGKAISEIYHFAPTHLKGGNEQWDKIKDEVADAMLECLGQRAENLTPENVVGKYVMTPLDIERYNPSMPGGDIQFFGTEVTQGFGNRPLPRWNNYKTPVENLYLVGSSTYPGGGVMGAARAAMPMIFDYLGLDFDELIR